MRNTISTPISRKQSSNASLRSRQDTSSITHNSVNNHTTRHILWCAFLCTYFYNFHTYLHKIPKNCTKIVPVIYSSGTRPPQGVCHRTRAMHAHQTGRTNRNKNEEARRHVARRAPGIRNTPSKSVPGLLSRRKIRTYEAGYPDASLETRRCIDGTVQKHDNESARLCW